MEAIKKSRRLSTAGKIREGVEGDLATLRGKKVKISSGAYRIAMAIADFRKTYNGAQADTELGLVLSHGQRVMAIEREAKSC